ncbi:MAG: type II secretion system protein GspG [Kiritimatiellaeota bacterium]|nr:type II secretion system protein GspG [Kiritimatiellota bacterium]
MNYRCPYCQHEMGEEKHVLCPACGKKMRYAERRTPSQRREDKRKIRLMEKEALQKRSAFDPEKTVSLLRNPRVLLWAMFVLVMLGVGLFKVSSGNYSRNDELYEQKTRRVLDETLAPALAYYRVHTGQWPSTNAGLGALVKDDGVEGWFGPYLVDHLKLPFAVDKVVTDPWGEPYVYSLETNGGLVVFSKGRDKVAGTAHDIHLNPAFLVLAHTNEWVSPDDRLPRVHVLPPWWKQKQ